MTATATAPAAPSTPLSREFRTPRAILMLLAALAIAALFAGLAQWQVGRAVQRGTFATSSDETVLPLTSVAKPGQQQTDASVGQLVRVSLRLVPGDWLVASNRFNDGAKGYWVVGHGVTAGGAQLVVGAGWTATRAEADAAVQRLAADPPAALSVVGRYVDSDPATATTAGGIDDITVVSSAQVLNLWRQDTGGPTYEGILTLAAPPAGLTKIYSPKPVPTETLNALNVIYAAEWTLFALLALYIWYRLIKDRWQQRAAVAAAA